MVDLQRLIDSSQLKGLTVKVDYPAAIGFQVEIAWTGKQEMQKIFDAASDRVWNLETRKTETELDRRKVARVWAERVVKGWTGLTIERMKKIWPVKVEEGVDLQTLIEPTLDNKIALLWNSVDFENWVLSVATAASFFDDAIKQAEKDLTTVEK